MEPTKPFPVLGLIPARYASTRFPAKLLARLGGKTIIRRVYEQAQQARSLDRLLVATDHPAIAQEVRSFGGECVFTSEHHPSGTDRCHEAAQLAQWHSGYVINIQGDEPFIGPEQIDLLARCLDGHTELATLMIKVSELGQLTDPGEAKIVFNRQREALYFSRQAIPHLRGVPFEQWLDHHTFYRHVGIYAYRTDVLAAITRLPVSPLEDLEKLEQLRWLENGFRIQLVETDQDSFCIETPEDLARAEMLLAARG